MLRVVVVWKRFFGGLRWQALLRVWEIKRRQASARVFVCRCCHTRSLIQFIVRRRCEGPVCSSSEAEKCDRLPAARQDGGSRILGYHLCAWKSALARAFVEADGRFRSCPRHLGCPIIKHQRVCPTSSPTSQGKKILFARWEQPSVGVLNLRWWNAVF